MFKSMKIFRWIYAINKRLFFKKSFVFLLIAMPLICLFLSLGIKEKPKILNIGIYTENPLDNIAAAIVKELTESHSAIKFTQEPDKNIAIDKVSNGKLNALISLPSDMSQAINSYARMNKPIAEIIEADKNMALSLARERLYMAFFPYISESIYYDFMINKLNVNDKAIAKSYYDATNTPDNFLKISFIDSKNTADKGSYLTSVMRGILAIWIIICGIAAGIYYIDDKKNGIFTWLNTREKNIISVIYLLAPLILCGVSMLLAIFVLQINSKSFTKEIVSLILLICATVAFASLLMKIFNSSNALLGLIPMLIIALLFINPIFIDIGIRPLQLLFPSFYYIKLVSTSTSYMHFLIYIVTLLVLNMIVKLSANLTKV